MFDKYVDEQQKMWENHISWQSIAPVDSLQNSAASILCITKTLKNTLLEYNTGEVWHFINEVVATLSARKGNINHRIYFSRIKWSFPHAAPFKIRVSIGFPPMIEHVDTQMVGFCM